MASIRKQKNTWYAVITIHGKQTVKTTGVKVEPKPLPPGKTKAAVMRDNEYKARVIANELEKGMQGDKIDETLLTSIIGSSSTKKLLGAGKMLLSVSAFLDHWKSKRTVEDREKDRKAVELFTSFLGDRVNYTIDKITKQDGIDFMNQQLLRVRSATVERYMQVLRTAWQTAVDSEVLTRNPFSKVNPPKRGDEQKSEAFTMEQIGILIKELPQDWADMVQVSLQFGGLRLGDVARMRWDSIDWDNNTCSMSAKKNHYDLTKKIRPQLMELFKRRYIKRIDEYVFPIAYAQYERSGNKVGKLSIQFRDFLLSFGMVSAKLKQEGDRKHKSNLSFHSIRATAVTQLRLAGNGADICRAIAGHESEEIQQVYFRANKDDIYEAMSALDL